MNQVAHLVSHIHTATAMHHWNDLYLILFMESTLLVTHPLEPWLFLCVPCGLYNYSILVPSGKCNLLIYLHLIPFLSVPIWLYPIHIICNSSQNRLSLRNLQSLTYQAWFKPHIPMEFYRPIYKFLILQNSLNNYFAIFCILHIHVIKKLGVCCNSYIITYIFE
jgi:hypothetical protein